MAEIIPNAIQSSWDLSRRDRGAVAYTKSMLQEGDTLVFISYPGDVTAYDSTGFPLDSKLLVNSSKLLATGSKVFANMLAPVLQARYRRAHKLQKDSDLPPGVKYVLDLTPPNEGDDAVEQISNLSCPQGIIHWSTAVSRCSISRDLIGGKDEVAGLPKEPISPGLAHDDHQCFEISSSSPKVTRGFEVNQDDPFGAHENENQVDQAGAVQDSENTYYNSMPASKKSEATECLNAAVAKINGIEFPKEYCPIRHRAGIERILQIIEGKNPRIDSATKAWTVAVLSSVFDCTSVVVDSICTWILTQKNALIIEILPEVCLRLGQTLQSQLLTRAAYSILVSEEALAFAAEQDQQPSTASNRAQVTIFGRIRDGMDEDTLNMVQHAGRDFQARIDHQVRLLLDASMAWLTTLPEHRKIQNLSRFFDDVHSDANKNEFSRTIKNLENGLRQYVRGRLFFCTLQDLHLDQSSIANGHRSMEQYMWADSQGYSGIYNGLSSQERVQTRQFWEHVRSLTWTTLQTSNLIYDKLDTSNPHAAKKTNLEAARHFNIEKVWMGDLIYFSNQFNEAIIRSISEFGFMGGVMPQECFHRATDLYDDYTGGQSWDDPDVPAAGPIKTENFGFDSDPGEHGRSPSKIGRLQPSKIPRIPAMYTIQKDSACFDLSEFLYQTGTHLTKLCDKMLSRGENFGFTLPDTLLCLEDEEYKYLPLYAGGFEDGTGGVYQDYLPPAIAGPNGPGPAYHTGLSTNSSNASSRSDFDDDFSEFGGNASTVGWSQAVDNGMSDHIDRRKVQSENSFGTLALEDLELSSQSGTAVSRNAALSEASSETLDFEEIDIYPAKGKGKATQRNVPASESSFGTMAFSDAGDYDMKWKGKGVDRGGAAESTTTLVNPQPTSRTDDHGDHIMDDNFFVEDGNDDFEFSDDSGDETEREEDTVMI